MREVSDFPGVQFNFDKSADAGGGGDALKQTADALGISVDDALKISIDVMDTRTPVIVVLTESGYVVVTPFPSTNIVHKE